MNENVPAPADASEAGGEDVLLQDVNSEFSELTVTSNNNVVLAFSLSGFEIPAGENILLGTFFVEQGVTNVCLEGIVLASPANQDVVFEVGH